MSKSKSVIREYRITWEIDVSARNPVQAAKKALVIQRDPCSRATVFDVWLTNGKTRMPTHIDLENLDLQRAENKRP